MKNMYNERKNNVASSRLLRFVAIVAMVVVWILIDKGNIYGQSLVGQKLTSKQLFNPSSDAVQSPMLREGDGVRDGGIPTGNEEGNEFTVKPNPVETDLVFDFEFTVKTAIPVQIYNPLGKLVDVTEIQPGFSTQKLDFRKYPTGMYILRLELDGKAEVRRIIKN